MKPTKTLLMLTLLEKCVWDQSSVSLQGTSQEWTLKNFQYGVRVMVFNTTFNNISATSWWSVLLVEETGVPGEDHCAATSHWQTLSHNVVSRNTWWPLQIVKDNNKWYSQHCVGQSVKNQNQLSVYQKC
jgi:hypothetical protein